MIHDGCKAIGSDILWKPSLIPHHDLFFCEIVGEMNEAAII